VLALPFTAATDRVVDAAAIAALPSRAVLINVARGRVLDEEALANALRSGAIRGAVLDVATVEPVGVDSPLWGVPNLVLTPHVSAINDPAGWWDRVAGLMRENLTRYAAGRELLNVVNGAAGY
jgi:phosphoglycerate dehydrogenase-like enzyme